MSPSGGSQRGKPMHADLKAFVVGTTTMGLINLSVMIGMGTLATSPLSAEASSLGIAAAIISSVVGGLLASLMAPMRATITAPSSSLAIIWAALATSLLAKGAADTSMMHLWALMSLTVVISGMLLVVLATLRMSDIVTYMPLPVSIGFVSGIGLLVILSQLSSWLGGRPGTLAHAVQAFHDIRPGAVAVGAIAIWLAWRASSSRISSYGPLAALAAGTGLHHLLAWTSGEQALGPTLAGVAILPALQWTWQALPSVFSLDWLSDNILDVLPFALLLAFQSGMNGAFTSASMSNLGRRRSIYPLLQSQGLANIVCGTVGALPTSTNAPLSLLAARHGPEPRVATASCVLIVFAAVVASGVLELLPLAAFAGVLIVSGVRMVDVRIWQLLRDLYAIKTRADTAINLLVILAVIAMVLNGRVGQGVALGIFLEFIHLTVRALRLRRHSPPAAAELPDTQVLDTSLRDRGVEVVRANGTLFFGNVPRFANRLTDIPRETRHLVLDFSRVSHLDLTAIHTLQKELHGLAASGVQTRFSGVRAGEGPLGQLLSRGPLAGSPCFADVDGAVESILGRSGAGHSDQAGGEGAPAGAPAPIGKPPTPIEREVA